MSQEITVRDLSFKPFISHEAILTRVKEMALNIEKDYKDRNPVFLVVLTGAFRLAGDMASFIDFPCEWDFIKLSSYKDTRSTGAVDIEFDLTMDVKGRDLIILEDIIDTGLTMHFYMEYLKKHAPLSVRLASLLIKKEAMVYPVHIDYPGFFIENKFVVGYGLDYNHSGRNLNDLWQVI